MKLIRAAGSTPAFTRNTPFSNQPGIAHFGDFVKYLHKLFGAQRPIDVNQHFVEGITAMANLTYHIDTEQEADGRWIAEITNLPGVMAYGQTEQDAIASAEALALRVIADQIEENKAAASSVSFAFG